MKSPIPFVLRGLLKRPMALTAGQATLFDCDRADLIPHRLRAKFDKIFICDRYHALGTYLACAIPAG